MKKTFLYLSLLIAFLMGGLFYSFTVKASPVPTTQTFTVMENTVEQLFNFGFVPQSLAPYGDIGTNTWDPWQTGGVLLNFDLEDCEINELNSEQKSALLSNWTIVNDSNINITTNDPIYSVKMDNGYFTGYVYVDDQGKILSFTNDLGGQLLQVKYGGSIKSSEDWENLYQSTATKIYESNMIYYNDYLGGSLPDVSYYLLGGLKSSGDPYVVELYIPNQYEKGVCVPCSWYSSGEIYAWYCNGTPYQFRQVWGNTHDTSYNFQVTPGTYTYNSVSYTYKLRRNFGNGAANNTYADWVSGADRNHFVLAHSGYIYNSNTASAVANVNTTTFKPIQLPQSAEIINYNYYYDPTEISRLEQALNDLTQTVNSNFNNQQSISENNFPFYYPLTDPEIEPSSVPFPGVENYPGFSPLPVPDPTPMPDPATAPSIGSDIGEVDPTDLRSTIPIINNLLNRFPFSIPWDIYGLLSGLSVQRETPYINTTIHIPGINYDWVLDYDLSEFDGIASLFRTLFLIAFILGLAYFSYDHFFGS